MRLALAFALLVAAVNVAAATGFSVGAFDQHVQAHHIRQCGQPVSAVTWIPLHASQRFRRCRIVAHYQVITTTPAPSPTTVPTAPIPSLTATSPATAIPPAPTATSPTATPVPPSDPTQYLLTLINNARIVAGLVVYSYDTTESPCSLSHSQHMSAEGFISHDQFPADICVPYSRGAGENVAMGSGDVSWTVQQTFDEMMAEQPPADGHRENILSSTYSRVGIGIYVASNGAWITEDFTG